MLRSSYVPMISHSKTIDGGINHRDGLLKGFQVAVVELLLAEKDPSKGKNVLLSLHKHSHVI